MPMFITNNNRALFINRNDRDAMHKTAEALAKESGKSYPDTIHEIMNSANLEASEGLISAFSALMNEGHLSAEDARTQLINMVNDCYSTIKK